MRKNGVRSLVALSIGLGITLSGCGRIDESILDTKANLSVDISVPYATATPLPAHLNVPDAIVIDSSGNVTLNDESLITGEFQSALEEEAATEYKNLSLGNTGIAVQALQARLKELGYFAGDVSGLFDTPTENAVKRFEQSYGTMQTGVATTKLQLKLFASTAPVYGSDEYHEAVVSQYKVLRPGAVGSSVYALQQRLKNLGYPISDLSGVYDHDTTQCVRLFYQAYGLTANDVANVALQVELYSDSARGYSKDGTVQVKATRSPDFSDASNAMAFGDSGDNVLEVQRRLIELGYLAAGNDTGNFDENTQRAVNQFLKAIGITPEGILLPEHEDMLFENSAPARTEDSTVALYDDLNIGDTSEAVMNLQRRLVELGYANGTPNGNYAKATINAVKHFQECNGMTVDGLASAQLQAYLYSADCLTYEETQTGQQDFSASVGTNSVPEEPVQDAVTDEIVQDADAIYFKLALGSTGQAVLSLETRLVKLGYLESAGNVYDAETMQAVTFFQNNVGVEPNGEASASMQRYLYSKAAPKSNIRMHDTAQAFISLSLGDTGSEVTALQKRLWELGFLLQENVENSIGTFHEGTRQAVIDVQAKMGYTGTDGVASPEFQCFLFSRFGVNLKPE